MAFTITIDMDSKIVLDKFKSKTKQFDSRIERMMNQLVSAAEKWIRHEAPHQTGQLKSATRHEGSSTHTRVYVSTSVAPYFKPIIDGHPTLTTDKSRRYWFAILKEKYGGEYKRKTKGEPGRVPPNDYINKAYYKMPGEIDRIVGQFHNWLVK